MAHGMPKRRSTARRRAELRVRALPTPTSVAAPPKSIPSARSSTILRIQRAIRSSDSARAFISSQLRRSSSRRSANARPPTSEMWQRSVLPSGYGPSSSASARRACRHARSCSTRRSSCAPPRNEKRRSRSEHDRGHFRVQQSGQFWYNAPRAGRRDGRGGPCCTRKKT